MSVVIKHDVSISQLKNLFEHPGIWKIQSRITIPKWCTQVEISAKLTNTTSLLPLSSHTSSGMPFGVLDSNHNCFILQFLSLHCRLLCQSVRHLISFHLTMSRGPNYFYLPASGFQGRHSFFDSLDDIMVMVIYKLVQFKVRIPIAVHLVLPRVAIV